MGFWLKTPENGSKYAACGCTNWQEVNSRFEFKELGFASDETSYHIFAYATKLTNIYKIGSEKGWTFEPQLVQFKIARKDWEKTDRDTKKTIPIKQSRVEKWIAGVLDKLEQDKIYSGFINLNDSPMAETFVTGMFNSQSIDKQALVNMEASEIRFIPVEKPEHVSLNDIKTPKSGWSSGNKSQAEISRLDDKLAFVVRQANLIEGIEATTLLDLVVLMKGHPEKELLIEVVNWALDIAKS